MADATGAAAAAAAAGLAPPAATADPAGAAVEPLPVTDAELAEAVRIVKLVAARPDRGTPRFRPLRAALAPFLEDMKARMFRGTEGPEEYSKRRRQRILEAARKQREKALDRNYINTRQLRAERLAALKALQEQGADTRLLIPDGAASVGQEPVTLRLAAATAAAEAEASSPAAGSSAPDSPMASDLSGAEQSGSAAASAADGEPARLHYPRACYICKKRYVHLHFFYDRLCGECAELNYRKRLQEADLRGRIAFVTGGRVKIGYQTVLKLLRCGAQVIVSTRFPHDAAARYAALPDYDVWKDRLHIYGLDLRDLPQLERFLAFLNAHYPYLDIIINNACQTVRRPPAYFRHLIGKELVALKELPAPLRPLLAGHYELAAVSEAARRALQAPVAAAGPLPTLAAPAGEAGAPTAAGAAEEAAQLVGPATGSIPAEQLAAARSALLSQLELTQEDRNADPALFPPGVVDVNQQQVDLRRVNSWLLKLEQVSTPELNEVMTINAMAPFIINARLRPLMERRPEVDKFIVNVSAMEGKFYRHKTPEHPHTNMAKAGLNMMTRTSAEDYAKSRIYMTAVDTGWINDENPLEVAKEIADRSNFQTPIDEVDAAARVLDPVFVGIREGKLLYGQFYKDYAPTEW